MTVSHDLYERLCRETDGQPFACRFIGGIEIRYASDGEMETYSSLVEGQLMTLYVFRKDWEHTVLVRRA